MDATKLKSINALQADRNLESVRHQEDIAHADNIAQTVLSATSSLIQYLENHTSKTEVINQAESISTPDVKYVVEALQVLDDTLKGSLTVTADMSGVVQTLREGIQSLQIEPEKPVDYTSEFAKLLTAVKAIKLTAEAPQVEVKAPNVHVDAPDMEPIRAMIADIKTALSNLKPPEVQKTEQQNTLISEKFDEYRIVYKDTLDEDAPLVISGINYFYKSKKVASLKYTYDKESNLTGVKRA